jgi:hypothetical protein
MLVIHIKRSKHHLAAALSKLNFAQYKTYHPLLHIDHHITFGKRNIKRATKWKNWTNVCPYEISEALNYNQFHAHASKIHEQKQSLMTHKNINGIEMYRNLSKDFTCSTI